MPKPDVYVDPKADPTAGRCLWCGMRLVGDLPMPQCPVPEVHDHGEPDPAIRTGQIRRLLETTEADLSRDELLGYLKEALEYAESILARLDDPAEHCVICDEYADHLTCCRAHDQRLCCDHYRRTHIDSRPCCIVDRVRLSHAATS